MMWYMPSKMGEAYSATNSAAEKAAADEAARKQKELEEAEARLLARLLVDMVLTDKYGIYHATNEGICNWYEFACEIFRQAGMKVDVAPVPASEYPTKEAPPTQAT